MTGRLRLDSNRTTYALVALGCLVACGFARAAENASDSSAPKPKRAGHADVTFDTIKFEMVKGTPFKRTMLTKQIEELVTQPIRIRGYIFPTFQQSGLTQFVLVRDNLECCFGPGAALYDCILVDMKEGRSTDYTTRPITVEGVFDVQEVLDPDGKHLAIYHLDGETVK